MSLPRPILKRASLSHSSPPHAVHFPPSCSLTSTFTVDSSSIYDRSPIVVSRNHCALPERGYRTYGLDDDSRRSPSRNHPRVYTPPQPLYALPLRKTLPDDDDPQRTPTLAYPPLPPLIPDLSSESDESDSSAYTPIDTPDPYSLHLSMSIKSLSITDDTSLSIPRPYHPPSTPTRYNGYHGVYTKSTATTPNNPSPATPVPPPISFSASEDEDSMYRPPRPRARRRSRERARTDTPSDALVAPPSPPKHSSRRPGSSGLRVSPRYPSSTFSAQQVSGCLGGF